MFSTYRLKSASHCAKNVCLVCVHPIFWIERRGPACTVCIHTKNQAQVSFSLLLHRTFLSSLTSPSTVLMLFNPKVSPKLLLRHQSVSLSCVSLSTDDRLWLMSLKLASFCKLKKFLQPSGNQLESTSRESNGLQISTPVNQQLVSLPASSTYFQGWDLFPFFWSLDSPPSNTRTRTRGLKIFIVHLRERISPKLFIFCPNIDIC